MPIMTYGGKILRLPDGIAGSPTCCCDQCTECCTKLLGGTWEDDAWTFRADADSSDDYMTVEISGIGLNKIICHGDTVTFTVTYNHDTEHGESDPNHEPIFRWDRAWEYVSHTPVPVGDGMLAEAGSLQYGDDIDVHSFTVELKYIGCEIGSGVQYGDIDIGWSNDTIDLLLEFEDCPIEESTTCCEFEVDCDPCCYYIPIDEGSATSDSSGIVFWSTAGDFDVRVTLEINANERIAFCIDEDSGYTLTVDVVPPPGYDGDDPDICIYFQNWWPLALPESGCDPPTSSECDGGADWYNHTSGWSVSVPYVTPGCEHDCYESPPVAGPSISVTLDGHGTVSVDTATAVGCEGLCCCDKIVACCVKNEYDTDGDPTGTVFKHVLCYWESSDLVTAWYHDYEIEGIIENYSETLVSGGSTYEYRQFAPAQMAVEEINIAKPGCPEKLRYVFGGLVYVPCHRYVDDVKQNNFTYERILGHDCTGFDPGFSYSSVMPDDRSVSWWSVQDSGWGGTWGGYSETGRYAADSVTMVPYPSSTSGWSATFDFIEGVKAGECPDGYASPDDLKLCND